MTLISRVAERVLSLEECKKLFATIESLGTGGGHTGISLRHRTSGTATWARGQLHLGSDTTDVELQIARSIRGASGTVTTSRLDEPGLRKAVQTAERLLHRLSGESPENIPRPLIEDPILEPDLWSDETLALDADVRGDLVRKMIAPADAAGLLAAGTLEIATEGHATLNSRGLVRYYPFTDVICSMSVRDTRGTASGWAGVNHYDVNRIDPIAIGQRALEKCQRMANPVGVEPGRYTAILEPQAVADLLTPLVRSEGFDRFKAEGGLGPFYKSPDHAKIGERVFDRRFTLRSDPTDPDCGFVPFERYSGNPYQAVNWIEEGVLRELWYDRLYATQKMGKQQPLLNPLSYSLRAKAESVTLEHMIETTERGIYVTRFHNVEVIHEDSMLCTGYTRDGIWLIEHGKITKPIKNFRFNESPMFALNNVESIGEPMRVFSPPYARVAPAIKVKEFSFIALADAV